VYLGMARDGALPAVLATVHPRFQSPFNAQLLCGCIAASLSAFLDVHVLASILSIGYVCSCCSEWSDSNESQLTSFSWFGCARPV